MMQKTKLRNDSNPGTWVLIWEYLVRAIHWIPAWQVLDSFQNSFASLCLGQNFSNLSIARVKTKFKIKQNSETVHKINHTEKEQ